MTSEDQLVGQRWSDDPERLGEDDLPSGDTGRHTERPGRLDLPLRHGLDAGADRLGHVGSGHDAEGDPDRAVGAEGDLHTGEGEREQAERDEAR